MKKIVFFCFLLSVAYLRGYGQNPQPDTLTYSGTRLTYPLVEGWIREFNKTNPGIVIRQLPKTAAPEKADLKFLAYNLEHDTFQPDETYVIVSNYAQLPIANAYHPMLPVWNKKGLTEQEFKKMYFKTEEAPGEQPAHHTVTIYKREKPVCATKTFASHYGIDPNQGKGVGVKGDDKTLLEAVLKDTHSISYNNLGFIYDLASRKLIDGIAVIPSDLNENGKIDEDEKIYGNLDSLIRKLENGEATSVTLDKVNIVYKTAPQKSSVASFLQWVQTDGQKLNHHYGFLRIGSDSRIFSHQKTEAKSIH
jgi:phosphate transport system substrate-binding protein